jgi:hydroxymethylbilane synthase
LVLRIGTRGSQLALTQTGMVADAIAAATPSVTCELVRITTTGDVRRTESLPDIGGKGLFTQELETALLAGEIDLAVHSLKDLPVELPAGLCLGAVPERAPAADALISASGAPLADLPAGAVVGTSSPRRAAQLLHARPDLSIAPIRGNLDTRLRKLSDGNYDAIVLAMAGLVRLGMADRVTQVLPWDVMLPAPGQGALGLESRADDARVADLLAPIHHASTARCVAAERGVLEALGGGCSLPFGAIAEQAGDGLRLRAILFGPDGRPPRRAEATDTDRAALAQAVAADLAPRSTNT